MLERSMHKRDYHNSNITEENAYAIENYNHLHVIYMYNTIAVPYVYIVSSQ